jgi:hypothetical protein
MPEIGILELIPDEELNKKKISLQSVIKLEQYFSVSHLSTLVRLKMLGLLDNKTFEHFKTFKATETAQQYGYDTALYKEGNHNVIIGDYGEKAKKLFDIEKILEGHYLELMQQMVLILQIRSMATKTEKLILLDTDAISHFIRGGQFAILPSILTTKRCCLILLLMN